MFDTLKNELEGCFYTVFTPFDNNKILTLKELKNILIIYTKEEQENFMLWHIIQDTLN